MERPSHESLHAARSGTRPPPPPPLAVRVRRAVFALLGLVLFAFVLSTGRVPCVFASLLHLPCPGCGSTRAMRAFAGGNWSEWLRLNPLAPLMSLAMLLLGFDLLRSILVVGTARQALQGRLGTVLTRGVVVVAVLEVALWLARIAGLFGGPVPV